MDGGSTVPAGSRVDYVYLTFWDKIALVCGAGAFLVFVAFCMICILCPRCLLHGLCFNDIDDKGEKKQENGSKKKKKTGSQRSNGSRSSRSSYGSTGSEYYYGAPESSDSAIWKPLELIKEDTTHSDWSSDNVQEVIQLEEKKTKSNVDHNGLSNGDLDDYSVMSLASGTAIFTLTYSISEEKLIINIMEVRNVQLIEGKEMVSPYMKIRLYRSPKQLFTFRGSSAKDHVINNLDKEFKTKMHRPCEVLAYKEQFEMSIDADVLKSYTVKLLLCDMSKLSRHVVLGETSVALKKTKLPASGEETFVEDLQEPTEEELGTINLGLSYLPTSEKMYLSIESIKGLKVMDKVTASTDACVKAYLMYDGKQLKRVKTTVRAMSLNPEFNETFSFDIPHGELAKVYFSLAVSHYNPEQNSTKLIGRVYMGMNFDLNARDHWTSMVQNPRKKVVNAYKIIN